MQTYSQADVGDSTIRSSKLKVYESCVYLYWASFKDGVPQKKNPGSEKGSIAHDVLELLSFEKHKGIFDSVLTAQDIYSSPVIKKLILKKIKESETLKPDAETIKQLNDFILTGMKNDFWIEGGKIIAHEYMFELSNDDPHYRIKGFFDKVAIKGDYVIIHDYKSSKKIYEGTDKESNGQALLYSVAAKKLWPDKKCKVIFIFLAHPDNPLLECEFTDDVLRGYERYLAIMQEKIDGLVYKDAMSGFACDKPMPTDGSFTGPLLCGFSKYKGQLKKDGSLMFSCPAKWPFNYYKILKDGKIAYTSLHNKVKLKEGETIEEASFLGCPRFQSKEILESHAVTPVKIVNPLDDF